MSGPLHVVPLGDRITHTITPDCICGPIPELIPTDHGDAWMYTHHSLDGREKYEVQR